MITNYEQLPIGNYLEIQKVCRDTSLEEIDQQVKILSILADMDEMSILTLPLFEYSEMVHKSQFLTGIFDIERKKIKVVELKNWTLIPCTDIRKVTTNQYIDFQTFAKGGDESMVELLSCLLVPKGCKYNEGYDIVELQKDIASEMSTPDAFALSAFFLTCLGKSINYILTFSKFMTKMMKKGEKKDQILVKIRKVETNLRSGGDGSHL